MYNIKDTAQDIEYELREWLDDKVSEAMEAIDEGIIDEHGVSLDEDMYIDLYNEMYSTVVDLMAIKRHIIGGGK